MKLLQTVDSTPINLQGDLVTFGRIAHYHMVKHSMYQANVLDLHIGMLGNLPPHAIQKCRILKEEYCWFIRCRIYMLVY